MAWPKVSIIIPTLSPKTKRYLDLCIDSIRNLNYPQDLLDVVISSERAYSPSYPGVLTVKHEKPMRSFAEAVNFGVTRSAADSKYLFLLSDDVILTTDSLKNLVHLSDDADAILGPISNCDNYWTYHLNFEVEHKGERLAINERFMRLEDVSSFVPSMKRAKSLYGAGAIKVETLCFYATLIPRKVWQCLGPLDERYLTGFEDSDYCERAKRRGIKLFTALDALVWHFGGVTTSETLTQADRDENERKFFEKWAQTNA